MKGIKKAIIGKVFFWSIILTFIFFTWSFITFIYYLRQLPNPSDWQNRRVVQSTKIFDREGKTLLYEIHGEEKRTVIAFDRIPESIKAATIVAEDAEFYQHRGINWRGIARAIINDLRYKKILEGGSSITQQLIKNTYLGSERTFARKFKEAILAIAMERRYSKDEILNFYLNQIPYGANSYGIEAAAQTYFDKTAQDLSWAEAAYLGALPRAPSFYSPYGSHAEELKLRANYILDKLYEENYLNWEEYKRTKNETVEFTAVRDNIKAPHFVFFVRDYLNNIYGENIVENGGLKVTTTLDAKLQELAEKIVKEGAEENQRLYQAYNASLVAIDPKTGRILAMVGSRDYWSQSLPENCLAGKNCRFEPNVNVAIRNRQPGSAFKPFVYATAFKKGYTPDTVLFDVPTEFNPNCNPINHLSSDSSECYSPRNYDGLSRGPVTLRQSLAQSLNVPSVKVLYLAGVNDSIDTAENLNITTLKDRNRFGLSLVLGGAEVKLLEMVSAFGVFSQEGVFHPKTPILKIEDANGNILEEYQDRPKKVLDDQIAKIINNILSDNNARTPIFGARSSLLIEDYAVAAKTGTTQENRDAWTLGYSPNLVAGVWVGNNDNTSMTEKGAGILAAGPLWHNFMKEALKNFPKEVFNPPNAIITEKPILNNQYISSTTLKINKENGKIASEKTPQELINEKVFKQIHSILWWLDKNDPQGPLPLHPEDDPQFKNWEFSVNNWINTLNQSQDFNQELPQNLDE